MAGRELGPGERTARRNRRRMYYFLGGSVVFGAVLGGAIKSFELSERAGLHDITALRLPPVVAALLAIGFLAALIGIPVYSFRLIDEVKVQNNLKAMSGACLAVVGGYPAWQALAAGGLVPQPSALGVFLIAYLAMAVLGIAFKIRG
ncbi:MAG: hypothetical protein A4S16_01175 [Proteobacteria bacterium SG_bin6]|nr:MAG: hypothetical protein A4S16_01175 [Proteobacteria bacterium SG_bin6]